LQCPPQGDPSSARHRRSTVPREAPRAIDAPSATFW
jgi:hypothetical protein